MHVSYGKQEAVNPGDKRLQATGKRELQSISNFRNAVLPKSQWRFPSRTVMSCSL